MATRSKHKGQNLSSLPYTGRLSQLHSKENDNDENTKHAILDRATTERDNNHDTTNNSTNNTPSLLTNTTNAVEEMKKKAVNMISPLKPLRSNPSDTDTGKGQDKKSTQVTDFFPKIPKPSEPPTDSLKFTKDSQAKDDQLHNIDESDEMTTENGDDASTQSKQNSTSTQGASVQSFNDDTTVQDQQQTKRRKKGKAETTEELVSRDIRNLDDHLDSMGFFDDHSDEDQENSIDSGKTSVIKKKHMKKIVIPSYVRYQLMIPPEKEEDQDSDNVDYRSNLTRIREILINMTQQIRVLDPQAEIISWKTSDDFNFMNKQEFPEDISKVAKFFKGYRKNMKPDRRAYIKFGIHTPNNFDKLETDLKDWAETEAYNLNRCLIQTDDAGFVGLICYSSYFTDTNLWKKNLMDLTKYEWGFKVVPITSEDKKEKWNKRLKAVGAFVPAPFVEEAKYEIAEILTQEELNVNGILRYQDRYLFVPPEDSIGDDVEVSLAYSSFVARQRAHINALTAKPFSLISIDIDKKIGSKADPRLSLREIILDIKVQDIGNPLYNTNLFHSVDFVPDTSKIWLGTSTGPGGPAYVFTYYQPVKREAEQMVQGLGRYVARMHGSDPAIAAFKPKYWKATKGWRYHKSTGTFDRPDEKHLKNSLAYDTNLTAIRCLQNLELVKEDEKKKAIAEDKKLQAQQTKGDSQKESTTHNNNKYAEVEELTNDTPNKPDNEDISKASSITRKVLSQEMELVKKIRGKSYNLHHQLQSKPAQQIAAVNDDDSDSGLSSLSNSVLTTTSNEGDDISISSSVASTSTKGSSNKKRITAATLDALLTPSISFAEAKKKAEALFEHRMNNEQVKKDRLLYTWLQETFPNHVELDESTNNDNNSDSKPTTPTLTNQLPESPNENVETTDEQDSSSNAVGQP